MATLGRRPGAAPLTSADIPDNSVTLAKMAGGTDGQVITYNASGDPVAVGPGTDGQVITSTGAGSPPAFEAIPAGGINSPWEHIASFATTTNLTTTYIRFQGVFTEEYTMYRIEIPFFNGGASDDNMYFRFLSGDIDSTAKSITAENSTTDQVSGGNYHMMAHIDGSDGGVFEGSTRLEEGSTNLILFNNVSVTVGNPAMGIRGRIEIWNPHKTKVWNYTGTPSQLSLTHDTGGDTSVYGPHFSFEIFGYEDELYSEVTRWYGAGYFNSTVANDYLTGFTIYAEGLGVMHASIIHLLGLKLDLSTS